MKPVKIARPRGSKLLLSPENFTKQTLGLLKSKNQKKGVRQRRQDTSEFYFSLTEKLQKLVFKSYFFF